MTDMRDSGGSQAERGGHRWEVYLDWGYRVALAVCALPALLGTGIAIGVFAHDAGGLLRAAAGLLSVPLACAVLLLPWRILLKNRIMMAVTLVAGCVAAHQLYASFGMFKALAHSEAMFVVCGVVLGAGIASLVLYVRRSGRRVWPAATGSALAAICFVFGAGNPQWSKYIFIWQVHYPPWRRDAANLPTNRDDARLTLPKYSEWDRRGHKTTEWSHPDGRLLRTTYYPSGQKKMERLYAEDQFVTSWYPNGQMEYQYDRQTRRKRAWDPNGAPREGEVRTMFPDSNGVPSVAHYTDGYFDGVYQIFYRHSGSLAREERYRNGLQEGVAKHWNTQGVLIEEEHHADGYRHGPRRRFREDGSLEWEETYERGVLQGSRKIYPSGTTSQAKQPAHAD